MRSFSQCAAELCFATGVAAAGVAVGVGVLAANALPAVRSAATIRVGRIFMAVSGCRCRLQRTKFCGRAREPPMARGLRNLRVVPEGVVPGKESREKRHNFVTVE